MFQDEVNGKALMELRARAAQTNYDSQLKVVAGKHGESTGYHKFLLGVISVTAAATPLGLFLRLNQNGSPLAAFERLVG